MKKVFGAIAGYFKRTDILFWMLSIFCTIYGLILIMSVSREGGASGQKTFFMQVIAVSLGYFAAILISLVDYNFIGRFWFVIAALSLGLMLLVFFIGKGVNGADDVAWLILPGGISFQPSELGKIAFIVTFAKHLSYLREKGKLTSFLWVMTLVLHACIPIAIVHLQGDDGAALIFLFMFLIMSFAAGVQLRYFVIVFGAVIAAVPIMWKFILNEDQKERFLALLDLEGNMMHYGYQQYQGKISIGSGELTGRGLFQGPRVAIDIVPEQKNDFIFTVAGEELGFVGCVLILALLLFLLLRSIQTATVAKDAMGKAICFGFFAMIAAQTVINLGMCLALLPVVGVTLPFFSAGGSSVACLYLGVGLVESVYMHQQDEERVTLHLGRAKRI